MIRYKPSARLLAVALAVLAGFVDATGFLKLGGFFISFMSGNTTRLAVGLARGTEPAAIAAGLIVIFVLGVIAGALAGHFSKQRRPTVVLLLVGLLLAAAAGLDTFGLSRLAVVAMGLAMGAENAVFAQDGEVHIGLTYMTGTLVKMGHRIAAAIMGGNATAWVSYFLLWFGLAAGAVLGATLYPYFHLRSLWLASLAAFVCSWLARDGIETLL
jgi:uncharacterized membrane protein YoaK (UPF0700 family)